MDPKFERPARALRSIRELETLMRSVAGTPKTATPSPKGRPLSVDMVSRTTVVAIVTGEAAMSTPKSRLRSITDANT